MKKDKIISGENNIGFMSAAAGTFAVVKKAGAGLRSTTPVKKSLGAGTTEHALWFDDDADGFLKKTIDFLKKDPEMMSFISTFAKSLYSGGIMYGTWSAPDKEKGGKKHFQPLVDAEIDDWLEMTDFQHYGIESAIDAKCFSNGWAELQYNKVSKKILSLSAQDASFCRFSKQNERTGLKELTYVSANWDSGAKDKKGYKTINPYYDVVGQFDELIKAGQEVIMFPLVYPGVPGQVNYQLEPWVGLINGSILELYKLQVEFMKYFLENGMTLKYHVEIDEQYFIDKYPNWSVKGKMKPAERVKIMQDEIDWFNKTMTGMDKTGRTLLTLLKKDGQGKQYSTWKVTVIDNKGAQLTVNEDLNQKTLLKLRGLQINQSLIGGVGEKAGEIGGGSGSDSRIAHHINSINNIGTQQIINSPMKVVKHVNGWANRIKGLDFITESFFLATLDQVSPQNRM